MNRREWLESIVLAVPAVTAKNERDIPSEITDDFEKVIRKHKLNVPGGAPSFVLAAYLYRQLVVFSEISAMRDRWKS